ncbi:MAG: GNAT family N-acetyltransferase [Acidimicrobiia bacterium]
MSTLASLATSPDLAERLRLAALADDEAITRAYGGIVEAIGPGLLLVTGPGSFLNGLRGVGTAGLTAADLERAAQVCESAGVTPEVVLPGGVEEETLQQLAETGYRLAAVDNVYVIGLPAGEGREAPGVVEVDAERLADWMDVHACQFPDRSVSDAFALAAHSIEGAVDLLAMCDDQPAGVGSLIVRDGRGLLGGAATDPAFRGRGLQSTLLRYRLWLAAEMGCDIACCTAATSGGSARNIERAGFRLVDVELSFRRDRPA